MKYNRDYPDKGCYRQGAHFNGQVYDVYVNTGDSFWILVVGGRRFVPLTIERENVVLCLGFEEDTGDHDCERMDSGLCRRGEGTGILRRVGMY